MVVVDSFGVNYFCLFILANSQILAHFDNKVKDKRLLKTKKSSEITGRFFVLRKHPI